MKKPKELNGLENIAVKIFEAADKKYPQQKDFAAALGLSNSIVSQWRMGASKSYTKYLPQISAVFGVTVDELIGGSVQRENKTEVAEQPISDTDARLLAWFRSLDPKKQKAILTAHDAPEDVE